MEIAPAVVGPAASPVEEVSPRERVRPTLDDERMSVSPLLGFGTNKLEFGVGLRVGTVAIAPHLWIGGTFFYHHGISTEGLVANVRYASSSSLIYMGPEVGYDFEAGPILIRPFGGIGPGFFHVSSTSANVRTSDNTTHFLLWMGGAVLYGIPQSRFFVGGDMRLVTVPLGPAFGMYAVGGMTF